MNALADGTLTCTVEREFGCPPEKLWRALTQPHLIAEWLMKNDFVARVGHQFKLTGEWGGVLDCEVLAVDPMTHLSYTWNFANDDPAYALESVVTFTLTPTGNGTLLRVEQSGFRPEQKQAFGGARAGWTQFLGKLQDVLQQVGQGVADSHKDVPALLSGGNPQIAKGYGEGPVQAYIAAMPEWKQAVGRRIDEIVAEVVPGVQKAVKWNTPFYGTEKDYWFLSFHVFSRYVKVTFFRGASLVPPPAGKSKYPEVRYLDIHENEDFEAQFRDWVAQASKLPGEKM